MGLKKGLKLMTIFTLIFTLTTPLFHGGTKAKATELMNVVDSVQVTHTDGSKTGSYDFYESFTTNFTWSAKSNNLKSGDTFTVVFGSNIHLANNLTFPLMTEDNQVAGEAVVDVAMRTMTVTFNSYVEGRANVRGTIQLQDTFEINTITSETVVPLEYTFNGSTTTMDVDVNPTPVVNPDEILIKGGAISKDDPSVINWNSRINFANEPINNAMIVDSLGPGQEFIQDSVVLTKQAFDAYGVDTPPSSIVPISDYTLTFDCPTKMTLDLGNITQSYRLTYQTKITDTSPDVYTNNIIISGDNIQPYSIDVESDTSSGSGTAGGDFGSFELIKVDKNDHTVNLADAEFTLKSDAIGTIHNLKTDTSGKASLDNLPLGDYTLTETKAPAGYQLDSNPVKVAINSTSKASYTFENEQLPPTNGAVEVTKVDSADATIYLADAEFNLVDENNNVVQTVTTNEAGKADLSNLVPGEYQLIETKAPAGYEIDSTPIPVSVNADQTTNITVENEKTPPAPVPPALQPPVTPTEPSKPVTPKNSNESQISVKEENQKSSKKLPKTGDNNQTLFLVLLGVGLLFSAYRIKKTTKAN
ncbi:hypothetical protein C1903_12290 [Listeria ivanovii]|uniref:SpaA isopeptide-forming pilin-related protein n=1 Tax=Listeria ivanovii TaxID=1638 RepID=UPI000DAA03F9|nr:SpaA isopeptide-forming pilin-related protein [Listeria ivanovii]PZF87524.1 hypothetical protein C1905_12555 [Listeria ivanovii]PZF92570.1 hypothetical protein C1903_12290 [Listeria ivanovii]PZG03640.1 hypothetical protein C2L88_12230 [Listeria ivanovii]PZG07923.1 hypothetical protein C1901_12340 [Listeria ivanovii]PZG24796.1 hypothetical protein C1900_12525 [Listeria ivanovii]